MTLNRILVIAAIGILGAVVGAAAQGSGKKKKKDDEWNRDPAPEISYPWQKVGAKAGCKGVEENKWCEYAPYSIDENYLFTHTHEQQNRGDKEDIREVLKSRGFAKQDWSRMLVIKNQGGKVLDNNFLHLNDIFDGQVSPNDFPVKVFLKETWKGNCVEGGGVTWCQGVRSSLYEACDGKGVGDSCSYESLKWEKKQLEGVLDYKFEGKCAETNDGLSWCKLPSVGEQQIEACLGKPAGKSCQYNPTGEPKGMYKGLCLGMNGALQCKAVKAAAINACQDKARGGECWIPGTPAKKGKCGFGDAAFQCLTGKPSGSGWPAPAPAPAGGKPAGGGSCSGLDKDVKSMKGLLGKIAEKMGVAEPEKPAARRRRRGSRRRKSA